MTTRRFYLIVYPSVVTHLPFSPFVHFIFTCHSLNLSIVSFLSHCAFHLFHISLVNQPTNHLPLILLITNFTRCSFQSKIIPTEENFLLAYSIQSQNIGAQLSSQDFLEIWVHYDKDCSGYLDFTG